MVGFPLLLIPLAVYNIIVFLMPGVSLVEPLSLKVPLLSGVEWAFSLSDILLASGILLLLLEIIKGARPGAKYLTDHLLSLIIFGAAAAEFVLLREFGTSTFFLLTLLALTDVLSGIALRVRRRQMVMSPVVPDRPATMPVGPTAPQSTPVAAPAPIQEPAAPTVPAATSVAESVLKDDPEPKPSSPEPASVNPPPESQSR